jgi:hypothetical protein
MQAAVLQVDLVDRHVDAAQRTFDGVHVTGNPPLEPGRLRSTGVYARRVLWIRTGEVATPTPKIWSAHRSQTPLAKMLRDF